MTTINPRDLWASPAGALPLCSIGPPGGRRLVAIVDDRALTYSVLAVGAGAPPVVLREHVMSLAEARSWAAALAQELRDRARRAA